MYYNNISIAFRKTFYFRDIIFRSSIDSIKEFSLSSYPEETTHYELYRRVNLFFFSRLDSSLSLSLGGREITRENVWKLTDVYDDFFTDFTEFFLHRLLWGQLSADFFLSRPVGISTKLPSTTTTSNERFYFPISIFDDFLSFFFLSLFFQDSSFSLSLSLFLVVPSTIVTTVSKETEINRDNIYLSPREERERKEKTNLTKNIDLILTSSFLIIIFPCTSLKKNIN